MYGMISYCMSKAGLEAFTRYAAAEFAPLGIRFNAISACPVDTNSMRLIKISEAEIDYFKKKMEKNIPLGRIAYPIDIVKAIVFLASERSKRITGQIIKVDGGRSLTSSGYVHYRGMKNMNSRFEPDGRKLNQWFNDVKNNLFGTKQIYPINDAEQIKKFVEEKINESNFSTRLSDAHQNINANYKIVDDNKEKLWDKYFKDDKFVTKGGTYNPDFN